MDTSSPSGYQNSSSLKLFKGASLTELFQGEGPLDVSYLKVIVCLRILMPRLPCFGGILLGGRLPVEDDRQVLQSLPFSA